MDMNKIVYINGLVEECRALGLRDGSHNAFLQEVSVKAKKTVADVARETEAFQRRGTMTAQIAAQMATAEATAMGALEAFVREIRALTPRARSVYGLPVRQAPPSYSDMVQRQNQQNEREQAAARAALDEIEAANGYAVLVAPTKEDGRETIQVVGVKLDALGEDTLNALRAYGHWAAAEVRQRQGIVN